MSKVNIVAEMLDKHTDPEIIEHLYRVMSGVVKNYRVALEKNSPEVLWGNLGDIELVSSTLAALHKRDEARLAQSAE